MGKKLRLSLGVKKSAGNSNLTECVQGAQPPPPPQGSGSDSDVEGEVKKVKVQLDCNGEVIEVDEDDVERANPPGYDKVKLLTTSTV